MKHNPFLTSTYQNIWSKHFASNQRVFEFGFLSGLKFNKIKFLPLYVNLGKNNTNGMSYEINEDDIIDSKRKVCLIHDVPNYYELSNDVHLTSIRIKKAQQYKGYLLGLKEFMTFDEYFKIKFSKSARKKHRGYINRLEREFDAEYKIYYGSIEKKEYHFLMDQFNELLRKRFNALGLDNDILSKWSFYEELVYPMIHNKTALLSVIYLDKNVSAISLAFLSDRSLIGAVKTFDVAYKYLNLGNIELIKLIEWTINNKYSYFDFSKGDQSYKTKYVSDYYHFDCHVVYDTKSIRAKLLASMITTYFKLKQYLRDQNINLLFIRLKYILKLRR